MSIITIVGAGMMDSAMSIPATDNGHTVRLVGTPLDSAIIAEAKKSGYHITLKEQMPANISFYDVSELEEALKGADLLIGGVSSFGVDWFWENVLAIIPESLPVLSITKGLYAEEYGTLKSFPEYYRKKLPDKKMSLNCVGGPCISFELAKRHNTEVAFCGDDIEMLKKIRDLLSTEYYHISVTTDVIGIESAVAMKNAYALAVSLAIGMGNQKNGADAPEEYNPQAGLFYQSVKEMTKIICLNGGKAEQIAFGAGDLYVTVFGGRTRRIGTLLGEGIRYTEAREILSGITLESVAITQTVCSALLRQAEAKKVDPADFPLVFHIGELLKDGDLNVPWKEFTFAD